MTGIQTTISKTYPELVSPAGSLKSLFVAFQYGADSVYLGLKEFSARAQAENFTIEELIPVTNYTHKINKKIYIAFNTLIKTKELELVLTILNQLSTIKPDGIIIQDLGVYYLIKKYFPKMPIHFSTQTTIYNIEGVKTLEGLGLKRVILARELNLKEIEKIRKAVNIELEVFIHGAKCYSYSGLCLFSSLIGGRSGNRGWCAQPCRMQYKTKDKEGYFFSMCDLMAVSEIEKLADIGINAFKIEGRMKNPIYTAFITQLYRNMLDHKDINLDEARNDLKIIFSREIAPLPQKIYGELLTSHLPPGHLGLYIGNVTENKDNWIAFKTNTDLEKYDGLQICNPHFTAPVGFSIRNMKINNKNVYSVNKDSKVTIKAPQTVPKGSNIYLCSKRKFKDKYDVLMPKLEIPKFPITLSVEIKAKSIILSTKYLSQTYTATMFKAKKDPLNKEIAYKYFSKLGNSPYKLEKLIFKASPCIFIPPKELNLIRRQFFSELEIKQKEYTSSVNLPNIKQKLCPHTDLQDPSSAGESGFLGTRLLKKDPFQQSQFSIKIDRLAHLEPIINYNSRLIIDLSPYIVDNLGKVLSIIKGTNKSIVFSLPPIIRDDRIKEIINRLLEEGFTQFEISNLGGLQFLPKEGITITSDYQLYITNPFSVTVLKELGIKRGTFSPELNKKDLAEIIKTSKNCADIVLYSNMPYFYSSQCVWLSIYKKCPGNNNCGYSSVQFNNRKGDEFLAINNNCNTIVINKMPFSWTQYLKYFIDLGQYLFRIDFINRDYPSALIHNIIEMAKNGKMIDKTLDGNFNRTLI